MDHHQPRISNKEGSKCNKETRKSSCNNALKVKYISSPMRVKTTASQFRSLVQQLTGKNSNTEQCIDDAYNEGNNGFREVGKGLPVCTKEMRSHGAYSQVPVLPSDVYSMNPYQMDLFEGYDRQL